MNRNNLVDKIIDYFEEAAENSYSRTIIEYDLNKLLEKYANSIKASVCNRIDEMAMCNDFSETNFLRNLKDFILR